MIEPIPRQIWTNSITPSVSQWQESSNPLGTRSPVAKGTMKMERRKKQQRTERGPTLGKEEVTRNLFLVPYKKQGIKKEGRKIYSIGQKNWTYHRPQHCLRLFHLFRHFFSCSCVTSWEKLIDFNVDKNCCDLRNKTKLHNFLYFDFDQSYFIPVLFPKKNRFPWVGANLL